MSRPDDGFFGRPFVKRFARCYQTVVSPVCLSSCPVLSVTLMYCSQTAGWIKMKLRTQVGLGPGHIVLDRDTAHPPPKGHNPQFSAHICCGQMAGWIKMPLGMMVSLGPGDIVLVGEPAPQEKGAHPQYSAYVYCGQTAVCIRIPLGMELGLSLGDIVLDGDLAPPPLKGHSPPQFLAHVHCRQTAGWTKMPLGMEVGLSPGDFVSWGPSSPLKGAQPPVFGPCLLWSNGWMDEDATWHGSRPRPSPHRIRRGPSSPPRERGTAAPLCLRPMSILTTVAHLSCC